MQPRPMMAAAARTIRATGADHRLAPTPARTQATAGPRQARLIAAAAQSALTRRELKATVRAPATPRREQPTRPQRAATPVEVATAAVEVEVEVATAAVEVATVAVAVAVEVATSDL